MQLNNKEKSTSLQQGIGMVEVLVTLVLLGVGLLGTLSLQANSLQSNQRASFVTEAHFLAQDMADKIVAYGSEGSNVNAGANAGQYGGIDTGAAIYEDPACGSVGASCDLDKTVELDRFKWQESLEESGLPNARGTVAWDVPIYTIRVMWDRDRTGATGTDCSSTDKETNLTCFEMQLRL